MTEESRRVTDPAPDRRQVDAHVSAVAAVLNAELADLVDQMRDVLAQRSTELDGDPALVDLLRASVEGNVDNILHALQHGIAGERLEPPSAAFEYARRLAQRGVPVNALVRAYRLGHQFLLRRAFDASAQLGAPDAVRTEAYGKIVADLFDYIDWITQRVVVVYEEERESWLANQTNTRNAKVRELLDSEVSDLTTAEREIGYRLQGHHVAVVAWVDEAGARQDQLSRFTRAVRLLGARIGNGRAPLVIGQDRATAWAWIPVATGYVPDDSLVSWSAGATDELPVPVLALGSARPGLAGFRRSHAEAVRVHHVGLLNTRSTQAVLSHDQPGMAAAALLAQQPDVTRDWVVSTLGDLALDDEQNAQRRATLLCFLRHDRSYTATAEAMVMHKNSIKYRVEVAEKALGRSLAANRLDVEIALNASYWLGPAVLRSS